MTNVEYIRSQLTDKDLSLILQCQDRYILRHTPILVTADEVFNEWYKKNNHDENNVWEIGFEMKKFLQLEYDKDLWKDTLNSIKLELKYLKE